MYKSIHKKSPKQQITIIYRFYNVTCNSCSFQLDLENHPLFKQMWKTFDVEFCLTYTQKKYICDVIKQNESELANDGEY